MNFVWVYRLLMLMVLGSSWTSVEADDHLDSGTEKETANPSWLFIVERENHGVGSTIGLDFRTNLLWIASYIAFGDHQGSSWQLESY